MKPDKLTKHPEGGRFQEVFRSAEVVSTEGRGDRSALTHIYFSLQPGEVSRFHRVSSDEVWNLYQGTGLKLYIWDGTDAQPESVTLSVSDNRYCYVIPAGSWQAAEPLEDAVLVGCSVAPGFEFSDFSLIEEESSEAIQLMKIAPEMKKFIVG